MLSAEGLASVAAAFVREGGRKEAKEIKQRSLTVLGFLVLSRSAQGTTWFTTRRLPCLGRDHIGTARPCLPRAYHGEREQRRRSSAGRARVYEPGVAGSSPADGTRSRPVDQWQIAFLQAGEWRFDSFQVQSFFSVGISLQRRARLLSYLSLDLPPNSAQSRITSTSRSYSTKSLPWSSHCVPHIGPELGQAVVHVEHP